MRVSIGDLALGVIIILLIAILFIVSTDGKNDDLRIQRIEQMGLSIKQDLENRAISPINVKYGTFNMIDKEDITILQEGEG